MQKDNVNLKELFPVYYNFSLMNGGFLINSLEDLVVFRCHRQHIFHLSIRDIEIYRENVKNGLRGKWCNICRRSGGEQEIERVLISLDIIYYREKPFPTLIHRHLLRFDFYISEYRLLIEFDGDKHFPGIREYNTNRIYVYCSDKMLDQLIRDQKKNKWAKKNDFSILRIPYWYFNFVSNLIKGCIKYITRNKSTIIVDDLEDWRKDSIKRASSKKRIILPEKVPLQRNE